MIEAISNKDRANLKYEMLQERKKAKLEKEKRKERDFNKVLADSFERHGCKRRGGI